VSFGRKVTMIGLGVAVLGASLALAAEAVASSEDASPFENLRAFAEALHVVETAYVEVVDQDALVQGALRGLLRELDPHSDYLAPEEYARLRADSAGHFGGIGVEVVVRDGWLTVAGVFPGGAAEQQGLQPGDRFLVIADAPARDMRLRDAVALMRGESGTSVDVVIRRADVAADVSVRLERGRIDVPPITTELIGDGLLHVTVHSFQEGTAEAVQAALHENVRGVLLDLRNNGGGLLREAVRLGDLFLDEGVIVSTRARGASTREAIYARQGGVSPGVKLVVLINGYTASAAEIVAAAVSDHERAVLVGERSFGKGSVQSLVELSNGGALKLTTALYFSPSGHAIQARGVMPDYLAESTSGQQEAVRREDALEGHLGSEAAPAGTPALAADTSALPGGEFAQDGAARAAYRVLLGMLSESS